MKILWMAIMTCVLMGKVTSLQGTDIIDYYLQNPQILATLYENPLNISASGLPVAIQNALENMKNVQDINDAKKQLVTVNPKICALIYLFIGVKPNQKDILQNRAARVLTGQSYTKEAKEVYTLLANNPKAKSYFKETALSALIRLEKEIKG